jgi:hypothetical protein
VHQKERWPVHAGGMLARLRDLLSPWTFPGLARSRCGVWGCAELVIRLTAQRTQHLGYPRGAVAR